MTFLVIVPGTPGMPVWWWTAWIGIAVVMYLFMFRWILKRALRVDLSQEMRVKEGTSESDAGSSHPDKPDQRSA